MPYYPLLALLLPCSALAAPTDAEIARQQVAEEFHSLDLDGDGYVSEAEAAGFREVVIRFDRADRNHDGKLSEKEFARLKTMKPPSSAAGGTARRSPKKAAH